MNIVKKTKKGYYNTLTKRYVSEPYAKRVNSYFKRNPKTTLYRASGHGEYKLEKPLSKHSKQIRQLAYGKKTQVIKTRTRKKKKVYYAPLKEEIVDVDVIKKMGKLEYKIFNDKIFVELYRQTRERDSLYHIITWEVNKSFNSPAVLEIWKESNRGTYIKIINKLFKISKQHKLSNSASIYGHIGFYSYSKYYGREFGKTFGMVYIRKSGYDILLKNYEELMDYISNKLKNDAYRSIAILTISFYITEWKRSSFETAKKISEYRIGVNREYHLKRR